MKIPEKLNFGAVEVRVLDKDHLDGGGLAGASNSGMGVICLYNDERVDSPTKKEANLIHESLHHILDLTGYHQLSGDEQLVSTLAIFLHQFIKQVESCPECDINECGGEDYITQRMKKEKLTFG